MIRRPAALLCALATAAAAAAQPYTPPPPGLQAQPPQPSGAHSAGEALFVEKCAMCHRTMGMGTVLLSRRMDPALAPLEKRDDLTADFVLQAARTGIGNMPRISRGEASDLQLRRIADYLTQSKH